MKTLLKDLPEFAERIENNMPLQAEIKEVLDDLSDYSESRGKYVIDADDFDNAAEQIQAKLTDFINQNYTLNSKI